MLLILSFQSTGYAWMAYNRRQKADENYAREIMQLFSIGLYKLNKDGTKQYDVEGTEIRTYTNRDIAEYARVYVGLNRQKPRGNIEDPTLPTSSGDNQIDPMLIDAEEKDHFPKVGIDRQYIGDGYPLCTDLPAHHFLKKGATYRLLGSDPRPHLHSERDDWYGGAPKRLSLNTTSSALASALCLNNIDYCKPSAKVVLDKDLPCNGVECDVFEPRTFEVTTGIWFEYVRPPCVKHAIYDKPLMIRRMSGSWGRYMCGNPESLDASTVCCDNITSLNRGEWRLELFGGERVPYNTTDNASNHQSAADRCAAKGKRICQNPGIENTDCADPLQGGCDRYMTWYWTRDPCSLSVKIDLEGSIAVIHQPGSQTGELYYTTIDITSHCLKHLQNISTSL
jgi:hypothetical protein